MPGLRLLASKSMERILVTGGAGFIGSNLARMLLHEVEARVVVVDKLTYAGHRISLSDLEDHERFGFAEADIADRQRMSSLLAEHRPSAVLNLAAESHVDRSIDDPSPFISTNVVGAFELLEACRAYYRSSPDEERRRFRFIHVSTDEVFGSLGADGLFTETTPYDPSSPYSASKAAADHLVRAYFRTYELPTIVTNCSNNYGPYQYPEKLIPLMILNAAAGQRLPIYGDGQNVRDWLHVDDHCRALRTVIEHGEPGQSYNVGGSQELTNLEVVAHVCAALEQALPASENAELRQAGVSSYDQLIEHVADRPGHDRRYAIDSSKIESELGWHPRQSFQSGIRSTVRWYLDHRSWCEAVQAETARRRLGLARSVAP